MPSITNYSPLIQSMLGGKRTSWGTESTLPGVFQFSQLNSSSIQSQLKAAGIDTSSKRCKAVIEQMKKTGCTGNMFTNVQAIKNLMKNYNSRGEFVDSDALIGLIVTDETGDNYILTPYFSDEMSDITWIQAFQTLLQMFRTILNNNTELSEDKIDEQVDTFMNTLPALLKAQLQAV